MNNDVLSVEKQTVYFKSAEIMEELDDNTITLVVTSPPYWNVRDYGFDQIGFNQSYKQYIQALNNVWAECIRVLQPNGKIAINLQPLPIASDDSGFNRRIIQDIMCDVQQFMQKAGLYLSGMNYWDKSPYINNVSWGSYPKPTNIATNTAFEQIYTFVKPGDTRKIDKNILKQAELSKQEWRHWAVRMIWDDISPVIKINSKKENLFGHGAPFPEDIPYRLIRMHTVPGEKVLDPFAGSGTTLKMCRITGRIGIGYEINPNFRSLIINRIKEDWQPPKIDAQYKTLGSEQIERIIEISIQTALESSNIDQNPNNSDLTDVILSKVFRQLKKESILSKANIDRIKVIYNEKHKGV